MSQELFESIKVGDVQGGNYVEISTNGVIRLFGAATCWDDVIGNLVNRRLYSVAGKLAYNYANNSITASPSGDIEDVDDCLIDNIQIPHAAKADGVIRQHIHWEQPDAKSYIWTRRYRMQSNGQAKVTDWVTDTAEANSSDDLITYVSGTLNQITRFPDIDITDAGISATFQTRIARTDSETGDVEMVFLDTHMELDSFGSDYEFVKWEES